MPKTLKTDRMPRVSLFLLLAAGLVRFINLGFLDMQAWDEGIYAVRAETISKFGLFLDQTTKAVDGLYSALHPPLYVWLTALSFEIFGVGEFAARFFSAVFGAMTIVVAYKIGTLLRNERTGLIAALLYGLAPVVLFYSRQGQFDATLVFFLSLSVYLLLLAIKRESSWFAFLAGLSTGAALMTKLFVGLGIPLSMITWILATKKLRSGKQWALFGVLCGAAVLVAAPWHIYMTAIHGGGDPTFFLSASSLFERTFSGVEGNVKPLGPLYFVNQFIVVFPVGVFWFLYSLPSALRRTDPLWLLIGIWFSVFFVVFSAMKTQLEVYILPMLVPASILAAQSLDRAVSGDMKQKSLTIVLTGTAIAATWAASQEWRNAAKAVLGDLARLAAPSAADVSLMVHLCLVVLVILVAATFLWNRSERWHPGRYLVPLHLVPLAAVALFTVIYLDLTKYVDGGAELAHFIHTKNVQHVLVVGYERNPQLSYYLDGADIGWESSLTFERIIPPSDEGEFKEWLAKELTNVPSGTLVVLERDKFIRHRIIRPQLLMPQSFMPVFDSRRYSAWVRKPYDTLALVQERKGAQARSIQ
jgi:4-amino-4-deoxy-L-arabinose transferase-like glycosyltransferase